MTNRGSVLILSLWIFALLGLLAGSLAYRTRIEMRLSRMPLEESRLIALARQAVYRCADAWRANTVHYTAFNQSWYDNPALFKDRPLDEGSYSVAHEGLYGMEDESSRINLNQASAPALRRLFGVHANVVPAILRWRGDEAPLADEYNVWGYKPRHGPFRSLDELRLVRGIHDEIFDDVQPYLTVVAEGGVNVNTASKHVLEALGLSPSLVNKIHWYRQGVDGRQGTADDGVFVSLGQVLPALRSRSALSEEDVRILATLLNKDQLTVQSDAIRLHLTVRLKESLARRHYTVISSARVMPPRIAYWREGGR